MLLFLAPFAELMAYFFRGENIPPWWEGVGFDPVEFELLQNPLTWTRWIAQAILRSTEQKIGVGEDASFRQGLVFAPILNSKPPPAKPKRQVGRCGGGATGWPG